MSQGAACAGNVPEEAVEERLTYNNSTYEGSSL